MDEPMNEAPHDAEPGDDFEDDCLEEELRQAAAILDPVPPEVYRTALEAFALVDLDAKIAGLTFDSLTHGIPVRGVTDAPRMLTFDTGELTVDVEVTPHGMFGQLMPPQAARIEVLGGARTTVALDADELGRFTSDDPLSGPFALRVRAGADVVVTEWLRA
ncbi:hypothetical protein ABZX85_08720 [Streptomyces sp. NPDC004539]|uniref:hypothetical protein n=1 Tax=Streptomyces sp. NPDC004539 TaxID=3154280 RepID=UPI0033A21796